jgi:hypothetical protein
MQKTYRGFGCRESSTILQFNKNYQQVIFKDFPRIKIISVFYWQLYTKQETNNFIISRKM